jgi:transcription antitermination protein NusB
VGEGSPIVSPTSERGAADRRGRAGKPAAADSRLETRARVRALQALYAWDVRCVAQSTRAELNTVAGDVWDDLAVDPAERRLAARIVTRVVADGAALDQELTEVTANWRLERLGAIERSVLRLAAAELAGEMAPPKVVIQEAVHLAERYGSAKSAHFVNGVLDALARRAGRL